MVDLGVLAPYGDERIVSGPALRDFVAVVEAAGVESIWALEHVVVAEGYEPNYPYSADGRMPAGADSFPMPDPLELLAYLAACSERVRLGTAVLVAPLHSAAALAKRAATLDRLSGGRLLLGLGVGWQREEYAAVGVPFERRGLRLEEGIGAMRALWRDGPSTFHGETVSFDAVHLVPKPLAGAVPIVLGGNSLPAVRRAGRLADGWYPFKLSPEDFAALAVEFREAARAAGRDPSTLAVTVFPGTYDPARQWDVDWVRRYVDAGATRLLLRPAADGGAPLGEELARYRTEVLDRL